MSLLIFVLFHFFQTDTPIVVARDTTFITEPLRPDGLPDYEKYVLKLYRGQVKPENNGAVLLWQAMMPWRVKPADIEPISRELGLPTIPPEGTSYKRLHGEANEQRIFKWLQENGRANASVDHADMLLDRALARPWKAEDFPPLRAWGRENNSAITKIFAATRRSEFYFPSPSLINDVHEPVIDMLLPGPEMALEAARALAFRAMATLGNGGFDPAWQDILAIHRLAHFVEQGGSLTEQAVAAGIRRIACDATATIVNQNSISFKHLHQIQRDLSELPEFSGVANSLDSFERLTYLDSILWLKAGHMEAWGKFIGLDADGINRIVQVTRLPADWNIVLRRGNEHFDQMVAAFRTPPGTQRNTMVSKIDANRGRFHKDFLERLKSIKELNPQERGELFFEMTISIFGTDLRPTLDVQDGANNHLRLTRIAAALAIYRADHGAYPDRLEQLVTGIIGALPTDISEGTHFVYQRTSDGYLLYTKGPNHADDNGSNEILEIFNGYRLNDVSEGESQNLKSKLPAGADDISIRVPIPALALPKASQPAQQP